MQKLTEQEVEYKMNQVIASFAMEDMILTEEEIEVGKKIIRGELNVDEYVKDIISDIEKG